VIAVVLQKVMYKTGVNKGPTLGIKRALAGAMW
jgi:hypothetical protein